MNATTDNPKIGTYPDRWKKGRYRVELDIKVPCILEEVDGILQKFGYHAADMDQSGMAYFHNDDQDKTAELEELPDPEIRTRIVLRFENLADEDTKKAGKQLQQLYTKMCRMGLDCGDDYGDKVLYGPMDFGDRHWPDLDD